MKQKSNTAAVVEVRDTETLAVMCERWHSVQAAAQEVWDTGTTPVGRYDWMRSVRRLKSIIFNDSSDRKEKRHVNHLLPQCARQHEAELVVYSVLDDKFQYVHDNFVRSFSSTSWQHRGKPGVKTSWVKFQSMCCDRKPVKVTSLNACEVVKEVTARTSFSRRWYQVIMTEKSTKSVRIASQIGGKKTLRRRRRRFEMRYRLMMQSAACLRLPRTLLESKTTVKKSRQNDEAANTGNKIIRE